MHETEGSSAVEFFFCLGDVFLSKQLADLLIGGLYQSSSAEVDDFADPDIDTGNKLFDLVVNAVGIDGTSKEQDVNILLERSICGQGFDADPP